MNYNLYTAEKGKEYIVTETPDIKLLSSIGIFEGAKIKRNMPIDLRASFSFSSCPHEK